MNTKVLAHKVRIHAINMTSAGGSSHIGSVLSIADILAVLYGSVMNYKAEDPGWENRDRFILSKGHAGAGVYAVLAESGFFSIDNLKNHYKNGSNLSGHISHKGVPGVEFSTGSLGHGLSVAAGMALAAKIDGKKHRIFVLLSDGECDEGSNWEAFLFSPHHKLHNLAVIIDFNNLQSIRSVKETLNLEPLKDKLEAFGWDVRDIDGHDHDKLINKLSFDPDNQEKPICVIARTTKGKGVSFMENNPLWHYRSPQGDEYTAALKELEVDL